MKSLRTTQPITSILNPEFRYRSSSQTDISKTFARIKKQLAEQKRLEAAQVISHNVRSLPAKKAHS